MRMKAATRNMRFASARKRHDIILGAILIAAAALAPSTNAFAGRPKVLGGPAWGRYVVAGWDMGNRFKPGHLFGIGFEGGSGRLGYEIDALYFLKTNAYVSRGWDYELGEISVPVMAKFRLWPGSTPFLATGVEAAYVISHKQKPGPSGEEFYDMTDNTRTLDYGLVFGAGYDLELGGAAVELAGRYHHGLAQVSGLGFREFDLRTRELVLILGLIF